MPKNRFSIYDAMENAEFFSSNPANPGAKSKVDQSDISVWPVQYPKMLYHPEGEERVVVPAELVLRAGQYVPLGEQRELIHKIVNDQAENDEAVGLGWHDHPAKAVRARVEALIESSDFNEKEIKALLGKIPQLAPSQDRIKELEAEIARLTGLRQATVKPSDNSEEAAA